MGQPSSKKNKTTIRHQFDRFCQKILHDEKVDYIREQEYLKQHEITFDEIPEKELDKVHVLDEYDVEYDHFQVLGYATYQRAIAAGYSVSDDEINDYLDDLKVTINDSINSEEAQALISQFGSEEGYWQHKFEVYKINLPIEKYLESLKQEYLKNSISTRSNNQEAEETIENYNRYIEEVQSELVKQEQYEIFE